MAIKCINLIQVICDDCGTSIMLNTWQEAKHLGWAVPCDGAIQQCPSCLKKYKEKIFAEAKLAQIAKECPLVNKIMVITNKQREILCHTAYKAAGGFYCGNSNDMQELVRLGLMVSAGKKSFVPDEYFKLTSAGRKALKG